MKPTRGLVVIAVLDPAIGHEQQGVRPCVVVSDPRASSGQRFSMICVVPITGTPGKGVLYPDLRPGPSGLTKPSFALVDHVRSIDKRRIRAILGHVAPHEIAAVDTGLALYLGLTDATGDAASIPH